MDKELQGREQLVEGELLSGPWKLELLKSSAHRGFEAVRLIQQTVHALTDVLSQVGNLRECCACFVLPLCRRMYLNVRMGEVRGRRHDLLL